MHHWRKVVNDISQRQKIVCYCTPKMDTFTPCCQSFVGVMCVKLVHFPLFLLDGVMHMGLIPEFCYVRCENCSVWILVCLRQQQSQQFVQIQVVTTVICGCHRLFKIVRILRTLWLFHLLFDFIVFFSSQLFHQFSPPHKHFHFLN